MKWPWQKKPDRPRPLGSKGNVDPGTAPRARPERNLSGGKIRRDKNGKKS